VLELLDAGHQRDDRVNIQHMETLNDAVYRAANTPWFERPSRTSFLKRADEVVNVDLTVTSCASRLRQGKIYAPEKVEQSLANFFRKGNLNMLRELALRTTAEQVGNQAAAYRRIRDWNRPPIPEKVMVCLSARPGNERLLRVGARIAGRLASTWYASTLHAPTTTRPRRPRSLSPPGGGIRAWPGSGRADGHAHPTQYSDALIRFGPAEGISHVVFGRRPAPAGDLPARSVINRFLSEVRERDGAGGSDGEAAAPG